MPLSPDDAVRLYKAIVAKARELKLDWIIAQVEEHISLGSVAPQSLSVKERDLFDDRILELKPKSSSRRRATFLVSQPYSDQEKLKLLIESLMVGIVELNLIYDAVVTFTTTNIQSSVQFTPETESRETFVLEPKVPEEQAASEKLSSLLVELKREITDAD